MTTTTDTGPDVQVTNADTGEVYKSQVRDRVDSLDGAASDTALHEVLADNAELHAELQRTRAELAQLQSIVSPLEAPWTPPREQPTAWIEEQTIAGRAATHRPSADTHTFIAGIHKQDRQRWDSVHDDIEALTAHEPADVWDDALRALLAPVETDWWEREDRIAVGLMARGIEVEPLPRGREVATYRTLCEQIWGMAYHGVLSMTSQPALPVTPAGEAFLKRGPAPAEGFDTTEALNKLKGRVKTAVTGAEAEPDGWVEATPLRRVLAWIGSRRKRGA